MSRASGLPKRRSVKRILIVKRGVRVNTSMTGVRDRRLFDHLDEIVDESVELVKRRHDENEPAMSARVLVAWVRSVVLALVHSLATKAACGRENHVAERVFVAPEISCKFASRCVREIAHATWDSLLSRADGQERSQLAGKASTYFANSENLQQVIESMYAEPAHAVPANEARTASVDSRALDHAVEELGVPSGPGFYVIVAFSRIEEPADGPADRPPPVLQIVFRRLSPATKAVRTVTAEGELWVLSYSGREDSEAMWLLRDSLRTDVVQSPAPTIVGVATAASAGDVQLAATEAREVERIASTLGYPPNLYRVADVELEILIYRSPDLAARLADRVAPLFTGHEYLTETLEAFLTHDLDRKQLARILFIHPNTLNYRLRRIHDLTGLSVTAPRDVATLRAGLISWRLRT